ncbi:unnamed protein product [Caenorhabditis bovis]|uniref:BUD13 homolog n=1 Tax=Caenorhabditis bovis TaxID=2654633 RepID=A0A8S1EPQ2_9PELO|nr:unnamed protein product [Caenorhabditis bovis]
MTSKADYLKKYLSNGDDEKKKKKKKKAESSFKPIGMRLIEDDAFLSVEAAKQKDIASDEEREELEVIKETVKKAKIIPGFKKTFAEVEEKVKQEIITPEQSPKRDNSPPRERRRRHDSDNSPPRQPRRRHDSDNSPPRQPRRRHDSDNSPPRQARRRHDSDNSPPRQARRRHDSDNSPVRNRKNSANSPARSRQRRDSDNSPPRRKSPTKRQRHDSDNSPPRRNHSSDHSPPRRRQRRDSDNSPPRKRNTDKDLSPPRRSRKAEADDSCSKKVKQEVDSDDDRKDFSKTLDGKMAGLQSAKALREESDKIRARDAKLFEELDVNVSGRHADTVYRTKQTKKRGRDSSADRERKEREAKKTEELKEKYKDWNKGVIQIQTRKEQLEEMARVAAEPLARSSDNADMNNHLKEVLYEADPMASMIKKKRRAMAIDRGDLVYPTYMGPWDPNRFNIPPGYRWDGVDRSNGFEGKLAKTANQKTANQSEYYKSIAEYE